MERPNKVKGCVGSRTATQILRASILPVVLLFFLLFLLFLERSTIKLFLLLDVTSSARPVQNPSGVLSSYYFEGFVMDVAEETFDVGSNLGVVPVVQSYRPYDELYMKSVGQRVLAGCRDCTGDACSSPTAPRRSHRKLCINNASFYKKIEYECLSHPLNSIEP